MIQAQLPQIVFIGGDILPGLAMVKSSDFGHRDFILENLKPQLSKLRERLREDYPRILLILGNDDGRLYESSVLRVASEGLWEYIHNRKVRVEPFTVFGYAYIPPTPFRLKDWERYDVSRYVEAGCISPEEGVLSVPVTKNELRYATIKEDLEKLGEDEELSKAVFLFHSPPYKSKLDRAALDGKMIDQAPLDVHVGSIAIRGFIEARQPLLTLHGHVHESARITGCWKDCLGKTQMFSAAHDGPELALVRFTLEKPENATRELI